MNPYIFIFFLFLLSVGISAKPVLKSHSHTPSKCYRYISPTNGSPPVKTYIEPQQPNLQSQPLKSILKLPRNLPISREYEHTPVQKYEHTPAHEIESFVPVKTKTRLQILFANDKEIDAFIEEHILLLQDLTVKKANLLLLVQSLKLTPNEWHQTTNLHYHHWLRTTEILLARISARINLAKSLKHPYSSIKVIGIDIGVRENILKKKLELESLLDKLSKKKASSAVPAAGLPPLANK